MRTRGMEACPTHSLYRREGMGETGSAFYGRWCAFFVQFGTAQGQRGNDGGHARN